MRKRKEQKKKQIANLSTVRRFCFCLFCCVSLRLFCVWRQRKITPSHKKNTWEIQKRNGYVYVILIANVFLFVNIFSFFFYRRRRCRFFANLTVILLVVL